MKLLIGTLLKFLLGLGMVCALLFLPAGTVRYPGGWLFVCLLFVPMLILGAILFFRAPKLLRKRLNHKEREATQKGVVGLTGLIFIAAFLLAGFDFRFGWTHVPAWLVGGASVVLLAAYAMYAEVMRENAYLSRTVEVQKGQRVIDSGLYGIVRHPMYSASVMMFLSIPLVLGSFVALLVMALYLPLIVLRILNEEKVLVRGLDGYAAYKTRVRYRLIPFVW